MSIKISGTKKKENSYRPLTLGLSLVHLLELSLESFAWTLTLSKFLTELILVGTKLLVIMCFSDSPSSSKEKRLIDLRSDVVVHRAMQLLATDHQ